MSYLGNFFSKLALSFTMLLLLINSDVYAFKNITENKENSKYIFDIQYPQAFSNNAIDDNVKKYIEESKKNFVIDLKQHDSVPADAPGKSGLNIKYQVLYQQNDAVSIRFDSSVFHKGAAHPLNTIRVLNFVQGKPVKLDTLFIKKSNYLKLIADKSNRAITAKKISDTKWIDEGTKATAENYRNWAFNKEGVEIFFESYQVAAYVYGDQSVLIKLEDIKTILKTDILKSVWNAQ